nr:hypothetical protein [Tanacetum cinerariifolium]
ERVKIFSEGVWAIDKCFPNIPTKQRSRPNGLSGVSRLGPYNVFNINLQKAEERVMSTAPNKQTRTSKVDGYQEPKQGIYPRNLPDSRIGVREEYTTGGPTNVKLVRGPRSGPMVVARFNTENGSGFVKRVLVNSPSSTPSEIKESGDETSLKSNGFMEFSGVGPFNSYGKNSARGFHNEPVCSVSDYQTMSMDNKLLMEIQSIRLCPELMVGALFSNTLAGSGHGSKQPNTVRKVDDEIDGRINDLENKYHEQLSSKTSVLDKLLKTATEAKALQEKESKQDSVDKHTVLAYQKYMSCYSPKARGCKSVGTKLAKKQALATVKQILEQSISNGAKGKRSISSVLNVEDDEPLLDFSHLEIPKMDVLGDAFGEQSLDVGSWLNIDDTILHDDDFTVAKACFFVSLVPALLPPGALASFRDKTKNPILSSIPRMSRNTSTPKQEDVTNFLQCSQVDPKAMASDYKFNMHGDFKKLANDALAPNASPDDLKKFKAGLCESITKGRPRATSISAHSSTPKPEQKSKNIRATATVLDTCFPCSGRSKPARPHTRRPSYHKANSWQEPTIVGLAICSLFWRGIFFNQFLVLQGSIQSVVLTIKPNLDSFGDILLCQRILSALISEKGKDNENDDTESNCYGSTFEDETSLKSNGFMEFRGVGPFYDYGKNSARGFHNEPVCSVSDYQTMSMDNKLLMETLPRTNVQKVDDEIDALISDLENKYHEQVSSKTSVLDKLLKTATEAKTLQEKKISFTDNESGQRCPQLIPFGEAISNGAKGKRSISSILNVEDDEPPLDFSHSEIPKMDVLGDAFGEQSLDVVILISERSSIGISRPVKSSSCNIVSSMFNHEPTSRLCSPKASPRTSILGISKCEKSSGGSSSSTFRTEDILLFPFAPFEIAAPKGIMNRVKYLNVYDNHEKAYCYFSKLSSCHSFCERVKIFSEGVWAIDKCFPNIPTKQRSRPNGLSGVSRLGPYNVFNINLQKAEERVMSTAPNKQTRTSKVDGYQEPKQGTYPRNLPNSRIGVREEYTAGGPTNAKLVRGPRSRSMVVARFNVRSKPARPHTRRPSYRKTNSRHEPTIVGPAVCSPFWRQIEPLFSFPSDTDICYLKQHSVVPTTKHVLDSSRDILLCLRILSALISEEGEDNENDDIESNGYGSTFEDETSLKSNGFMEFSGVGPFYSYGKNSTRGFHNEPVCSVLDYQTMSMDNKLLMEIQSIRLCPELMVGALFSNTLVGSGHGSKQEITCSCCHGFVDKDLIN